MCLNAVEIYSIVFHCECHDVPPTGQGDDVKEDFLLEIKLGK